MRKAILVIDMPSCCDECFALDDNGDYPMCLITQEQRGYTFRTREQKMDRCPLRVLPEEELIWFEDAGSDYERGFNACLNEILGGHNETEEAAKLTKEEYIEKYCRNCGSLCPGVDSEWGSGCEHYEELQVR